MISSLLFPLYFWNTDRIGTQTEIRWCETSKWLNEKTQCFYGLVLNGDYDYKYSTNGMRQFGKRFLHWWSTVSNNLWKQIEDKWFNSLEKKDFMALYISTWFPWNFHRYRSRYFSSGCFNLIENDLIYWNWLIDDPLCCSSSAPLFNTGELNCIYKIPFTDIPVTITRIMREVPLLSIDKTSLLITYGIPIWSLPKIRLLTMEPHIWKSFKWSMNHPTSKYGNLINFH